MNPHIVSQQDRDFAAQIARQGGGSFINALGQQCSVPGKNQAELLNDVISLLTEIRDLLKKNLAEKHA